MRYFMAFMMAIVLLIILILLLLRGGGSKPTLPAVSKTLQSYASTSAEVRFTTDGPINADSLHQQIQITVDRDNVTFEQLKGYEGNSVKLQHYANNKSAYTAFLFALKRAGFTLGDKTPALQDERGYCAQGSRYIFELIQDGRTLERFWATSCGKPKSYLGALGLTMSLFQAQVPDYQKQIQGIQL